MTLWTVSRQAALSMGFCRQERWSGLPFPPPGGLSDPGIRPAAPALQAGSLPLSHREAPVVNENDPKTAKKRASRAKEGTGMNRVGRAGAQCSHDPHPRGSSPQTDSYTRRRLPQGSGASAACSWERQRAEGNSCLVAPSDPALSLPHGLQPARLLYPRASLGKNTGWVAISSSRGSS